MSESNEYLGSTTGKLLAIGAACFLVVGGCTLCGGGLVVPFVLKRRAVEMQRVEAQRQLEQSQEEMRKKAAQDAVERQSAVPAGGDSSESHEHE
jgi:hypothetical protein